MRVSVCPKSVFALSSSVCTSCYALIDYHYMSPSSVKSTVGRNPPPPRGWLCF